MKNIASIWCGRIDKFLNVFWRFGCLPGKVVDKTYGVRRIDIFLKLDSRHNT
jgi:hypothetical protein